MRSGALAACDLRQHGLTWVLTVEGEADATRLEMLETAAKDAELEPDGILTVDLTKATFVDTSFIRWLVGLKRRLERPGASFVVIVSPGQVSDVFAMTGLADELTVVEDGVSPPAPLAPA